MAILSSKLRPLKSTISLRKHVNTALNARPMVAFGPPANELIRAILWAYDITLFQLFGLPKWAAAGGTYFDIEAIAGRDISQAECRQMLQALLADRFKLRVHRETRAIPIYALVLSEKGPKLQASTDADEVNFKINGVPLQTAGAKPHGWPMELVAQAISGPLLDRPVVDCTGMTGFYKIEIDFEWGPPGMPLPGNKPDIFGAVEKMGLKLDRRNEPLEVIVIDSLEMPEQN